MFMRASNLLRTKKLVEKGIIEAPVWLEAMEKVPPVKTPQRKGKLPMIVFPEDKYVAAYYKRHPEDHRLQEIAPAGFTPLLGRRFAQREMELLEQGLSRAEACAVAEGEFVEVRKQEWLQLLGELPPRGGDGKTVGEGYGFFGRTQVQELTLLRDSLRAKMRPQRS